MRNDRYDAASTERSLFRTPSTWEAERLARIALNLIGAATAALFAQASLRFYVHTHRLIGGLFFVEQAWIVIAFLIRRSPHAASHRIGTWLLAFGALMLRTAGAHPPWGVQMGFAVAVTLTVVHLNSGHRASIGAAERYPLGPA